MTTRSVQPRVAWALCGLAVGLAITHTWLFLGWSVVREGPTGWPVLTFGLLVWTVLGAVIVTRRPGHRVAWLFIVGAVLAELGNTLASFDAIATAGAHPDPPAVWATATWLAIFLDVPEPLMFLILIFLLFPTGHLPSRRWRPLLWASWTSFGLFVLLLAVAVPPWRIEPENRDELVTGAVVPIGFGLLVSLLLELLAAAASVVVRMRNAHGVERQQLRWLAVSSSMVAVSFVLAATLPVDEGWGNWLRVLPLHLSVVAVGAGAALAILRYRLYDLDVAISRAILLTVSTGLVAVVYVLLVVLVGGAMPDRVSDAFWPSLLATAAVALAFQPVRRRIVRFADRLAFGRRAAPYEALARLGRSLQQAPGATDLMRNLAQAVAESTGARRTTAVLELPGGAEVTEGWPVEPSGPQRPSTEFVVSDRGERLARVEVELPAGRHLSPAEDRLVNRLLAESALAVRNLRLERQLAERVAELDRSATALLDSRRRLVRARDEEKSRFAEALRESVLPHLEPLPPRLAQVASEVAREGAVVDLQPERDATNAALEALRRLVRGGGAVAGQARAADQASSSRSGPNADLVT
jgi:hypothetical protein